jgi:hypothetical protein
MKFASAALLFIFLLEFYGAAASAQFRPADTADNTQIIVNRLASMERENTNLIRELDQRNQQITLLNIKEEVSDSSHSRLEIIIGTFGILITLLVLAFGFRTAQAASQAARAELADRRSELDGIMAAAAEARRAAEVASTAAQRAAESAALAATQADEHATLAAQRAAEASEQMSALREAAKAATASIEAAETVAEPVVSSPTDSASLIDLQTLQEKLAAEQQAENWTAVRELSRQITAHPLALLVEQARASYWIAYATGKLDGEIQEVVEYTKVIDKYSSETDDYVNLVTAIAYVNRGLTYANLDMPLMEDEDYDVVIEKYSNSKFEPLRHQVAEAFFWKAANLADKGKVVEPISFLEKWKEYLGRFDCDQIMNNVFFRPIISRPKFMKYLRESGCEQVVNQNESSGIR